MLVSLLWAGAATADALPAGLDRAGSLDPVKEEAEPDNEPSAFATEVRERRERDPDAERPTFTGRLGAEYVRQAWQPTDITDAHYTTTGLNLIRLRAGATLENLLPIGVIDIELRGDWSPTGSTDQRDLVALRREAEGQGGAYEAMLGDLRVALPFSTEGWGPGIFSTLERQVFLAEAQALKDYWYYSDGGVELLVPGDTIRTGTVMRRWSGGVSQRFGPEASPILDWDLGFYLLDYRKPYTHDLFTRVSRTAIFDARFTSVGGLTAITGHIPVLRPEPLSLRGSVSLGRADIRLSNISASDVLPDDARMWMVEGTLGARAPVFQPGMLRVVLGLEYTQRRFGTFFSDASPEDDTVNDSNLNTDHIIGLTVGAMVSPSFAFDWRRP
ncbi:MAG: hypothetical protein EA398_11710 [Deltaproteobacteria bacterium]|nr:MAG: hypothetical protein EA398_11710 [Deltaproteobacteria bacterium]